VEDLEALLEEFVIEIRHETITAEEAIRILGLIGRVTVSLSNLATGVVTKDPKAIAAATYELASVALELKKFLED